MPVAPTATGVTASFKRHSHCARRCATRRGVASLCGYVLIRHIDFSWCTHSTRAPRCTSCSAPVHTELD